MQCVQDTCSIVNYCFDQAYISFIRYTVSVQPDENGQLTATRCNCTFCQKLSNTNLPYHSASNFTLISPTSKNEVSTYAPRNKALPRYFCDKCGAHVWMEGSYEFPLPDGGRQKVEHFSVNLPTIDQPQDGVDLSLVKIKYWDGLNGNFGAGLGEQPWPNGVR